MARRVERAGACHHALKRGNDCSWNFREGVGVQANAFRNVVSIRNPKCSESEIARSDHDRGAILEKTGIDNFRPVRTIQTALIRISDQ